MKSCTGSDKDGREYLTELDIKLCLESCTYFLTTIITTNPQLSYRGEGILGLHFPLDSKLTQRTNFTPWNEHYKYQGPKKFWMHIFGKSQHFFDSNFFGYVNRVKISGNFDPEFFGMYGQLLKGKAF